MSTVRAIIRDIQRELRPGEEVTPERASQLLVQLSSLYGNVLEEIREADLEYALVLLRELEADQAASRAKIRAETTPEYSRKREARDFKEVSNTMIASLKYFLRSKEEEMRLAR